jgi:hypothetical protein
MASIKTNNTDRNKVSVQEPVQHHGFVSASEEERLKKDIYRPDMEKLSLFTQMLRRNALLKKAKITHAS